MNLKKKDSLLDNKIPETQNYIRLHMTGMTYG